MYVYEDDERIVKDCYKFNDISSLKSLNPVYHFGEQIFNDW